MLRKTRQMASKATLPTCRLLESQHLHEQPAHLQVIFILVWLTRTLDDGHGCGTTVTTELRPWLQEVILACLVTQEGELINMDTSIQNCCRSPMLDEPLSFHFAQGSNGWLLPPDNMVNWLHCRLCCLQSNKTQPKAQSATTYLMQLVHYKNRLRTTELGTQEATTCW